MCSITFAKYILLLGYFYFSLNIEGKGKRDEHIISQIIFTRCLRLTFTTSKMPKNLGGGGLQRSSNPQLTCSPGFASLGKEHKKISELFSLCC